MRWTRREGNEKPVASQVEMLNSKGITALDKSKSLFASWHKAIFHGDNKQCNRFPVKSDQLQLQVKCKAQAVEASNAVCDGLVFKRSTLMSQNGCGND